MSDLSFIPRSSNEVRPCDLAIEANDIALGDSIKTAIVISLFSDARSDPSDGRDNPRGWWGDSFTGNKTGSRLWLIKGDRMNALTIANAQTYAKRSLQWMITDGVASSVEVSAQRTGLDTLALRVVVTKPDNSSESYQFDILWQKEF